MHILARELFTVAALVTGTLAASANTTTSSHSDNASSSRNIGDYVAAGFGLVDTTTQEASSATATFTSTISTGPSWPSSVDERVSASSNYANTSAGGGNTVKVPLTSYFTSCEHATTDSFGHKNSICHYGSTIVTNTFTNTSWALAANADACWTEWNSYWSMHKPSPATISVISYAVPETTQTTPYVYTLGSYITDQTITSTITSTAPTVADNGGFTQTMSQVVVTYTTVLTEYLSASTTSTSMYTRTYTPWSQNFTLISASNDANWPTPSCTMPAIYPACQSQWDEYASHNIVPNPQPLSANCEYNLLNMSQSAPACYTNIQSSWASWRDVVSAATSPICSQASITGSVCTSLKDAYVLGHNYNLAPDLPEPASFSSGYYSNVAPWFTGWTWPATQAFAPGCTLDCGRCAVTGGTIQLLYFPPGLTPHAATEPVVATTLGTVLTSPTYYISFESLYASDACKGVGSTLTSMILPIPTSEPLSTLFATTMPCDAHRMNNAWLGMIDIGTASLNVTDLMHDSVPYSIYTSQPYCATHMAAAGCDPDACPTTLPYRPLIVLSSQLLNTLNPEWASCSLDLRGLYDPPRALQPAGAIVKPTAPGAAATTPATPASGLASVTPAPTAQPEHEDPSPSRTSKLPASASANSPDSPSVAAPTSSSNKPSPTVKQPGGQHSSDDSLGVLVSMIAGMSNDGTQSQHADASGAPIALSPGAPDSESASAMQSDNGDPAPPAASHSDGVPGVPQDSPTDPSHAANPSNDNPTRPDSGDSDDPTVFSVGSQMITATPGQPLVVAGSTLPGDAALTVSGHTYSSGSAGLIIDGTSAVPLSSTGGQDFAAVFTVGSQILTASAVDKAQSSAIVVEGSTLVIGGSAATIAGTVVSAGSAGLEVGDTQTVPLSNGYSASNGKSSQSVITLGSSTITAFLPQGTGHVVVVDGTTLSPGGSVVTIDGTEVSADNAGLVIGGTGTESFTTTTDRSQTSSKSDSSSPSGTGDVKPESTSPASESGGQRVFDVQIRWMSLALALTITLGCAVL